MSVKARVICRGLGHRRRIQYHRKAGFPVVWLCIRCGDQWPFPTPNQVLHRDRADVGMDCVTLGKCSTDGHTMEWPCDFS